MKKTFLILLAVTLLAVLPAAFALAGEITNITCTAQTNGTALVRWDGDNSSPYTIYWKLAYCNSSHYDTSSANFYFLGNGIPGETYTITVERGGDSGSVVYTVPRGVFKEWNTAGKGYVQLSERNQGKTDLNYFDSEALCRAVANYPIPVFTGIGHEIDKSLLDEVAYLSCITPTDCAKRLVERAQESWTDLVETARNIASSARDMLTENRQRLSSAAAHLQQDVTLRIQGEKTKIVKMFTSLERDTRFMLREETARLDRNVEGLKQGTRKILDLAQSQFKLTELRVKSADPETALAKGYTLTLDSNGKFIRNAAQLKSGDTLRTKFRDGTVESVVQ